MLHHGADDDLPGELAAALDEFAQANPSATPAQALRFTLACTLPHLDPDLLDALGAYVEEQRLDAATTMQLLADLTAFPGDDCPP